VTTLADNRGAIKLAGRLGRGALVHRDGGVVELTGPWR
jgi:hypothetical protein